METARKIRKLLVANRGEIAVRIFRTCAAMGIRTVALYTQADSGSPFWTYADEAYAVGGDGQPVAGYLDIASIIEIALKCGADAIHPGYGFLSESAEFAKCCSNRGIAFIGPTPGSMEEMSEKLRAKAVAARCHVPVLRGSGIFALDEEATVKEANEIGYPVMLKASYGGGGRGIRKCQNESELRKRFRVAAREAERAFGHGELFVEKCIENPKHIEVQVLGDQYGHVIDLGTRDCSIQRNFQKIIEYAPAFSIDEKLRQSMRNDAVSIAAAIVYVGAGTVEFLVDGDQYWFMEMNTRLQVEHTVTEMVTGIDLVRAQILIAEGKTLDAVLLNKRPENNGYAIQCRVTAEDPENAFCPNSGVVDEFVCGGGYGIRYDGGGIKSGTEIQPYFDSLLVKLIAHDETFAYAASRMLRALAETKITGITTNTDFLRTLIGNEVFLSGNSRLRYVDEILAEQNQYRSGR